MSKRTDTVLLGFEVGPADPVEIPLGHLCVAGQTQSAGKTTTLEALIGRSGRRAVAFVTKRGEGGFAQGRRIPPYFRERADWVFVASLIDATLGEKNKILRSTLMKVCRNTRTLADVQATVRERIAAFKGKESFVESLLTEIDGYLDLVVPQLATLRPAPKVEIGPGLNVMDLTGYSTELQGLVIRSVLEWVYEREKGVITVIPEAWEFIPQSRGSPVTLSAEELIRKGATLGNYLWLDSQDISNINARIRKSVHVWLLGVQREKNEIKHTVGYVTSSGVAAPKASDVATLEKGQFYACFGRRAIKTYVWPAWMKDPTEAGAIATGKRSVEQATRMPVGPVDSVHKPRPRDLPRPAGRIQTLYEGPDGRPTAGVPDFAGDVAPPSAPVSKSKPAPKPPEKTKMEKTTQPPAPVPVDTHQLFSQLQAFLAQSPHVNRTSSPAAPTPATAFNGDEEVLYQCFKVRLLAEVPAIVAGGPVTLTPPEKLRKDFQRDEADRLVAAARGLRPLAKRILKLIEAIGEGFVSQKAIAERLGRSTGGQSWMDTGKAIKELASLRFVEMKERQGVRKALRDTIASDLSAYHPADAEIEAVYQNVLYQLATEEAE